MLRISRRTGNCLAVVALVVVAAALAAACAGDAPDVALRVNGHPVTYGEIADVKERFKENRDDIRRQIDHLDTAYPDFKPWLEEIARGQEKYGVDAVAIGGIVKEYAMYDAAIKAGFSASDDEVAMAVSTMQSQHEQFSKLIQESGIDDSDGCIKASDIDEFAGSDECIDIEVVGIGEIGSVAEYIDMMGNDEYWDEVLPAVIRRNSAVGKWKEAAQLELASAQEGHGEGGVKREEWARIRREVELSALADVNVEVVDEAMFDEGMVRDALEYSREITYAFYPD